MTSIGYATDLAVRAAAGSIIETRPGYRVIRSPENPGFRWGNFLLLDEPPTAGSAAAWAAEHQRCFAGADFATIGVDAPGDFGFEQSEWIEAGFTIERYPVLTAASSTIARATADGAAVHPVRTERDWAGVLQIDRELNEDPSAVFEPFAAARIVTLQRMVASGRAEWLVAELDDQIVSTLGIVGAGDGLARYQAVGTTEAYRKRGLASMLLGAAADVAETQFGCDRLVIVAENSGPAAALYRSIGFAEVESQVELERLGASHRSAV